MCGSSTSTSTTTIPPEMLQAYRGVTGAAQNFYGSTTPQNYSNDPNAFVAPLTATQQAGISNVNSAAGQAQPFYQQAANTLQGANDATAPFYGAATQSLQQGQQQGQYGLGAAANDLYGANMSAQGYQGAGISNIGQAYANAQPYNVAASQGTAQAQDVGAGLGMASLGTLGQAQQQGQDYTQGAYQQAQGYNHAAGRQYAQGLAAAQPLNQAAIGAYYGAQASAQPLQGQAAQNIDQAQQGAQPYNAAAAGLYGASLGAGAGYNNAAGQSINAAVQGAQPFNATAANLYGQGMSTAQPYNQMAGQGLGAALNGAQPYNGVAAGLAGAGAGAVNAQQIGGDQINQFMSPYINSVLQGTAGMLNQQNQQAMSGQTGNAIMSGAFGGDRAGIAAANLAQQQQLANAQIYSGILNQGYGQALGAAQQQQGVNLGAQQANRAALQNASSQFLGIGQQGYNQGTNTAQQQAALGQQVFGQANTTGQNVANLGQQVYGQGLGAASQQAALGQQVYGQTAGAGQNLAALGQQQFGQGMTTAEQQAALGQQQFGQGATMAQGLGALGQQVFGQGQTAGQNTQSLGQQVYGQGTGTGSQLFNQGATAAGQQAALGQQQFGQGLSAAQQQAAIGQQQFGQGTTLGQSQIGMGQQQFGQGLASSQQQAALGQQGYSQGLGAAQGYQNLAQGMYGQGLSTAQQQAALGAGAQGASLQGAQAQLAAGQTQQQTQQAALQALYNQWFQTNYGLPQQLLNTYAGAVEGIGQNAGSTTTTTQPGGLFASGGRAEKAGGGGLGDAGGYDPNAMAAMLNAHQSMYGSSGGDGPGPVKVPNFAGTPYVAPTPGAHTANAPGHDTPASRPNVAQQATESAISKGLQGGEEALGKKAIGMAKDMMPMDTSGFAAAAAPASFEAAAAPAAETAVASMAPEAMSATAAEGLQMLPAVFAAMARGGSAGRPHKDGGGWLNGGLGDAANNQDPSIQSIVAPVPSGGSVDGPSGILNNNISTPPARDPIKNALNTAGNWLTKGMTPEQARAAHVGPEAASAALNRNVMAMAPGITQNLGRGVVPPTVAAPQHTRAGLQDIWGDDTPAAGLGAAQPQAAPQAAPRMVRPSAADTTSAAWLNAGSTAAAPKPASIPQDPPPVDSSLAGLGGAAQGDEAHAAATAAHAADASAQAATGNTQGAQQAQGLAQKEASQATAQPGGLAAAAPAPAVKPPAPSVPPAGLAAAAPPQRSGFHLFGDTLGKGANIADQAVGSATDFAGDALSGLQNGLKGYGSQLKQGDPNAWIPLLKGVGAMAAAPTRNFGVGLAQGLAAGASAYYPTQQEQAGVAQTKAETGLTGQIALHQYVSTAAAAADAARNGLFMEPDPNGNIKTPDGTFRFTGTKPMLAGARADNGMVGGAPTKYLGDAGKRVAENAMINYGSAIKNDPSYAANNNKAIDQIREDQSQAVANKTQINKYATVFTGSNPKDALAPGAITPMLAPYAAVYNSVYDKLGLDRLGLQKVDPAGLTNAQLLDKMSNQLALADQAGAHDSTLGALRAALTTKPGAGMDAAAGRSLLADTYIANRRADDLGNYAQEIDDNTGLASRNFDATAAKQAFAKDHNPYDKDRHALTTLLADSRYQRAMDLLSTHAPGSKEYQTTIRWLDRWGNDPTFHQYFVKE